MKRATILAAALAGVLAGCTTKEESAELRAASQLSPSTQLTIAGDVLRPCAIAALSIRNADKAKIAIYSPTLTNQFSERVYTSFKKESMVWAKQVRAYVLLAEQTNFFGGRGLSRYVCYYALKNGQLNFLTVLSPDGNNAVSPGEFYRAVSRANEKLQN